MDIDILELRGLNSKEERVLLQVSDNCNTSDYMVMDTTYDGDGNPSNIFRHCYFFPEKDVEKGDYILLYTGKGKQQTTKNEKGSTFHKFYWGSEAPIWNNDKDIVHLIRYNEMVSAEFE